MSEPAPQVAQPPAAAGQQEAALAHAPRYRSKHLPDAPVPCSLLGEKAVRARGTMGPGSREELVSTSKWLRAHEHEPRLPQPAKPAPKERRKAPLVPRDEAPLMGMSSGKDFVQTNVLEATQAAPKYKEQEEVRYVFKPHFGELPPYLRQRNKELAEQRAAAERAKQPPPEEGVQVLQGEELAELVRHLKLKWQSLNEVYVRLPCVLDTPSKRRRKEELEAQLAEIERDVRMLSKATSVRISTA
ncbi:hypothetical protein ABPG75_004922 [Micractinium tetrahymenae]